MDVTHEGVHGFAGQTASDGKMVIAYKLGSSSLEFPSSRTFRRYDANLRLARFPATGKHSISELIKLLVSSHL